MRIGMNVMSVTGQKLEAYTWLPEGGDVKAVVQLVHGMSEHILRYEETAAALNAAGFAVVGHTHLGHGKNAPKLGYFDQKDGWDALIADTHTIRKTVAADFPGKPYFLLGHSMGSFVVRTYCLQYEKGLSGVILSGTGHQPPAVLSAGLLIANVQILFGMGQKPGKLLNDISFGSYNKGFAPARTAFDWLSSDENVVDEYIADPYCGFPFTVCGYRDMFKGLFRLAPKNLAAMDKTVPVLLLSGACDPVGGNGAGVRLTARELLDAGVKDVTVTLYENGRHEMFNEKERARVVSELAGWITSHM